MRFFNILLLAGTASALAFPAPGSIDSEGCCCCDVSRSAIVCNPDIPSTECICTLAKCPDDAPTITESPSQPTPPPVDLPEPIGDCGSVDKRDVTPSPPSGKEWCCCCNGQDNVCSARDIGVGCFCTAIACPEDAQTFYPMSEDRPGRPDRPERPGRPGRPTERVTV